MGGFNQNKSSQQSQSQSYSGLRGTGSQGIAEANTVQQGNLMSGFANQFAQSPSNMFNYGQQMLPTGRYGMGPNADSAVDELVRQAMSTNSASYGARGFVSPENHAAVAGSAMQNVLPQLIPQIGQYQQQQFMAPQNLFQMAGASADFWNRALGAQSTSSSSGSGSGWGFRLDNPFAGSGPAKAGG